VVPRASLDECGMSFPAGSRSLDRTTRRQSLCCLRYPSPHGEWVNIRKDAAVVSYKVLFSHHLEGRRKNTKIPRYVYLVTRDDMQAEINVKSATPLSGVRRINL
jgi:hypothetical protein